MGGLVRYKSPSLSLLRLWRLLLCLLHVDHSLLYGLKHLSLHG
jgi:hypothetical protein